MNGQILGSGGLPDAGDDYGCNVLQTDEKIAPYLKSTEDMRKFFRTFECRLVRDVGTSKFMACVVAAFDEGRARLIFKTQGVRDVK